MAGDLEDFLRRAAERRAQKQQQGAGGRPAKRGGSGQSQRPKPQPRSAPEYTDARRERQIRPPVEEEVFADDLIEVVNPLAEKQARLAKSKKQAAAAKERVAQQQRDIHEPTVADRGQISISGGTPAEQLLDLLQRPGGIQQAFLLREILERPEDRWK